MEVKRSVRLQMMMTLAEVIAIDDWRFANRIGNRADAARRLTKMGLQFSKAEEYHEGSATSFADNVRSYADALRMIREAVEDLFGPVPSLASREQAGPTPEEEAAAIIDALQRVRALLKERPAKNVT